MAAKKTVTKARTAAPDTSVITPEPRNIRWDDEGNITVSFELTTPDDADDTDKARDGEVIEVSFQDADLASKLETTKPNIPNPDYTPLIKSVHDAARSLIEL